MIMELSSRRCLVLFLTTAFIGLYLALPNRGMAQTWWVVPPGTHHTVGPLEERCRVEIDKENWDSSINYWVRDDKTGETLVLGKMKDTMYPRVFVVPKETKFTVLNVGKQPLRFACFPLP